MILKVEEKEGKGKAEGRWPQRLKRRRRQEHTHTCNLKYFKLKKLKEVITKKNSHFRNS